MQTRIRRSNHRTSRSQYRRHIDFMFYNYRGIKKAVEEERQDAGDHQFCAVPGSGKISKPTENMALNNMSELRAVTLDDGRIVQKPESWLKVVEGVYNSLGQTEKDVIHRRYWRKEPYEITIVDLAMSQAGYYFCLDTVRSLALAAACQLGLMKVI